MPVSQIAVQTIHSHWSPCCDGKMVGACCGSQPENLLVGIPDERCCQDEGVLSALMVLKVMEKKERESNTPERLYDEDGELVRSML